MDRVTDWQPGQVGKTAMGSVFYCYQNRGGDLRLIHTDGSGETFERSNYLGQARPLVVLDPESGADARDLLAELLRQDDPLHPDGSGVSAALTAFANPKPRIEEPTGLGAAVECESGITCVRTAQANFPWVDAARPGDNSYHWTEYGGLPTPPVRILSEGVSS